MTTPNFELWGRQMAIPADLPVLADGTPDFRVITNLAKFVVREVERNAERIERDPKAMRVLQETLVSWVRLATIVEMLAGPAPASSPPVAPRPKHVRRTGRINRQIGTTVYVARTAAGRVLYVGVTDAIHQRLAAHQAKSPWWHRMATVDWEEHATRHKAEVRETELIRLYRPPYNTAKNPDSRSTW